jgi:hypothetical protein
LSKGITEEEETKLRSRKRKKMTEPERWEEMYGVIFPGEDVPEACESANFIFGLRLTEADYEEVGTKVLTESSSREVSRWKEYVQQYFPRVTELGLFDQPTQELLLKHMPEWSGRLLTGFKLGGTPLPSARGEIMEESCKSVADSGASSTDQGKAGRSQAIPNATYLQIVLQPQRPVPTDV